MSINQQNPDKINLPDNNFISNIGNLGNIQSKKKQKNNDLEQNTELLNNLNNFFSISSTNISKSNDYLCSLINSSNISNFTNALLNPVNFNLKLFASNSLLYLFTNNYTEIEIEKVQTIFESLLDYLFLHKQVLYEDNNHINNNIIQNNEKFLNDSKNEKLFMNSMIKLIARIIRVFYPQCNYFKKFVNIILSKSLIYNNDSNSIKLIINIFAEVIYQFQTYFGLNKNIIQMTKNFKTLEEFKEGPLINIFNYTCDAVTNIIGHKIQTDNFKDILQLSKQVVLCLEECLDYSEDSNIKEEDYNKYEIKPTYIPSPRRKGKDKKLNIMFLLGLCQNLFDLYDMILKTYISINNTNNNNTNNNNGLDNINDINLDYYYASEGVLKILNSLICMKIQYLDINKGRILKSYTSSLGGILFNKYGFIHHEYLCQIIYRLKKNYNYLDLTSSNETFWSLILPYIENSVNLINNKRDNNSILSFDNTKNNIINSTSKFFLPGTLYLLHFLGYFSHNLYKISLNYQIKLKQFILSICKKMMEIDFSEYQCDISDICESFGSCGEGVYIQILEDIISYIQKDYKNMDIINLCFKIRFGIEVLKNNYQYIEEQRLINKLSYNDLESFSEIDLSDDKPEINAIVNYIKCVFDIIKDIIYKKDSNICENKKINHFGFFSNTLLKFIKFFCKHFLSKYLNNSLTYMINSLLNDDTNSSNNKEEKSSPEDLIVFIFNILICFNVKNEKNNNINEVNNILKNINNYTPDDKLINHKIVLDILNILYDNFTFETDYSNKICQIQNLNVLNNSYYDNQTISSKYLNENNINNDNDFISQDSSPSRCSDSNKNSSNYNSSILSTPKVKSNLLNNESIENISKISFSQKLPTNNYHKNNHNNKNRSNLIIINESEEIAINSVDIHLGKIRLDQDKFINILKNLFNRVIVMNSDMLSFKTKKHFLEFLFKIIFQCYLPFESAISYFIDQFTKISSKDIKEYIYIINSMISSVTTQENYQILIDTLIPSIQNLCSSIISQTYNNNLNNDSLICLKKILKLLKDMTNLEKSHIKAFNNNSQSPIYIFSLIGNLLDYYISLANNISLKNLSEHKIYLIQIKPISYIVQIYYNLFCFYIQVPLFINTNYNYMKQLFFKITKIIFTIDMKNLIGYCDKFKKLMILLKIIYCDYIIQNYGLINNNINIDFNSYNEFICDVNFIPNIIQLIKYILNEDYLENSYNNSNNSNNDNNIEINNFPSITKSSENIRECYKDFNDIIYEWCKLYIQYKKHKTKENKDININTTNKEENQIQKNNNNNNNNLSQNSNNNNSSINSQNNSINNNTKILFKIFNDININSLLYDILLPILQGIILNYYSINEISNSLSKTVFIMAYTFTDKYFNIFNSILNSNKIKQFYNDEEINNIKSNFEQLNNIQNNNNGLNNGNNNLNGVISSYYNIFREKLNEFAKKIQNIIISRKKDINDINYLDFNDDDIMIDY